MATVLVLGDSIARGDGASTPARSFVRIWVRTLPGSQQIFFFCRGGATVLAGLEWAPYVWSEPSPDYILVAYGMNDQTLQPTRLRRRPQVPVEEFGVALRQLAGDLPARFPEATVILMSSA